VLPFPVILAPYLRTLNSAPRRVAPRPLPFPTCQRFNAVSASRMQLRDFQTFQHSDCAPLPSRSFALFCRSLHQECFTTLLQSAASALFRKIAGCHPTIPILACPELRGELFTRHSHCIQVLSAHTLTNAPSRNSLRCTSLQMPRGGGGCILFSDSSTL
jgi:hypothetical protein